MLNYEINLVEIVELKVISQCVKSDYIKHNVI